MSKLSTCSMCKGDCRKRDILCAQCWNGLADRRKQVLRKATYRRDEVGKKFIMELITCSSEVLTQIIANSDGGVLEPTKAGKFLKSPKLETALNKDENKKEAKELV